MRLAVPHVPIAVDLIQFYGRDGKPSAAPVAILASTCPSTRVATAVFAGIGGVFSSSIFDASLRTTLLVTRYPWHVRREYSETPDTDQCHLLITPSAKGPT